MYKDCRNAVFIFYIWQMKAKWYLGTFIAILTLFGASLQQFSVPNQEIVVQFDNEEITLLDTQNTIAIVKKQLQNIGAEKIQVYKGENGKLKITYISTIDVASIKKIFSEEKELKLSYSSIFDKDGSSKLPFDKNSNKYQLDVFEIQKNDDQKEDFNGLVIELLPENDRFFNPDVYYSNAQGQIKVKNGIEKVAYIIYSTISIEIDNSSHNIPEVRAGPVLV